jgi:hypothetical protein
MKEIIKITNNHILFNIKNIHKILEQLKNNIFNIIY